MKRVVLRALSCACMCVFVHSGTIERSKESSGSQWNEKDCSEEVQVVEEMTKREQS